MDAFEKAIDSRIEEAKMALDDNTVQSHRADGRLQAIESLFEVIHGPDTERGYASTLSSLRAHAQDRLSDLGAAREVLDGALSLLSEVKNSYTAHKNFCNDDGNLLLAQIEKLSEQLNINQTKGELHGNPERLSGLRINN